MIKTRKIQILGLTIIAFLLLVLLAVSFPELQMQPGNIFPFQTSGGEAPGVGQLAEGLSWSMVLFQGVIAALILLLPVYILIGLLSKEERNKLLANVIMILLLLLIMIWPYKNDQANIQPDELFTLLPEFNNLPKVELDPDGLPTFQADLKPWLLPLIMIGTAVLLAAAAFFSSKFLSTRDSLDRSPYLDIAENAQTALEEIEGAKIDFDDIIIRCYAEMSHTLQTEQGIQRDQAMTTSEFEQELLSKGFPAQPIQRLTQLFEQVRYGHQHPMEDEKQVAAESLSEIIDFCRGKA